MGSKDKVSEELTTITKDAFSNWCCDGGAPGLPRNSFLLPRPRRGWGVPPEVLRLNYMDACYARCNCWTDFPDMGGQITHEVDALCMMDACWCSFNQNTCPFGTLKTNPYCCTKQGITCRDIVCDTDGNCDTKPEI